MEDQLYSWKYGLTACWLQENILRSIKKQRQKNLFFLCKPYICFKESKCYIAFSNCHVWTHEEKNNLSCKEQTSLQQQEYSVMLQNVPWDL